MYAIRSYYAGVTAAFNGGTHMPFEDVALYRTIPTATIIDITDVPMLISVLKQCKDLPGVKYIRVGRKSAAKVFADGTETPIGPAITLREGKDVVITSYSIHYTKLYDWRGQYFRSAWPRCHLPTIAVWYPLSRRSFGNVRIRLSMGVARVVTWLMWL